MIVYRIGPKQYNNVSNCLSGLGGMVAEGRWHYAGAPIVYTASTRSLAMLERLVNDSQEILKENLSVVIIQIPDTLKVKRLVEGELPAGWNAYPYAADTQSIGSDYLMSEEAAVLQVPSSLCPEEYNFIINPQHSDASKIKCIDCSDFVYPNRLATKL
ncbi:MULTISPECIES: RES family NAD+ phosphorylase [unclassified Pseudoalteromonas]|jgi:RES domain-containing protein|uniref:RES family NAD+ phosphorylase n=1 Tax=unclassified Pseudoalteromonas TaxID=194690 RepID=UPI0015FF18DD|nr:MULTISPECIES: RES family NAD+ phosphorylase [unclassified Pseudoalteromonas]MBB1295458.1 RES family NAD+ phosphorylase [Pseudoalteromonas sp. SR41-4]MBB1410244.1 RES family NAD+ phosphorylase [Pseudoalteromonas sp. SG44-17]MBB1470631.1 RES family NAD+ phosphorylase [Pseudoalteromonas sp. SG41-5]|tara:strand:+ start:5190 stop:5663 length:474 start_codon:yes stop_codon:yes gene_type:complete